MPDLLAALLLGIIEGITEFLPISSTGHLLIAEHWLGARTDLFNVAIQAGAILAVVAIYWQRLWSLLLGFAHKAQRDYALKLIVAFGVTGALGLAVKKLGFQLPETLGPVAWALLLGGFVILAVEAIDARRSDLPDSDPNAIGWGTAVLVGLAQVLAGVFPGTSRSAAAIFAALLFGRSSRVAATEFAFLVGIPTMFAATGYELMHTLKDGSSAGEDWGALGVAFVVSALTAFAAVKWLLRYIQTHRFTVFAWYRVVLGAALLAWLSVGVAGNASATSMPPAKARPAAAGASATVAASEAGRGARGNATAQADAGRMRTHVQQDFAHLYLCHRADALRSWKFDEARLAAALKSPLPGIVAMARRELEWHQRMQAWMPAVLAQASRECTGGAVSRTAMREAALQAANLGDFAAAECYFAFAPESLPAHNRQTPFTPEELAVNADYVANLRRLVAQGIAAGDWRMVSIAAMSADGRDWSGVDDRSDPSLGYRMHRLLQRGLSEARHRDAMGRVADVEGQQLSVEQLRAADAWVEAHYRRDFADKGLMNYGALCPFPGEPSFPVE